MLMVEHSLRRPSLDIPPEPHGLWSLWDMLRLIFGAIYHLLGTCTILRDHAESLKSSTNVEKKEALISSALETLRDLSKACSEIELVESVKYIDDVVDILGRPVWRTVERLAFELRAVMKITENEARGRLVYYVKKQKAEFREEQEKFWKPIKEKFQSAVKDIDSAGICYAVDENTACVFHLMRVAEYGLRALARERRVVIPKRPLEWANWQDIISGINKKTEAIASRRAGPARDKALDFYRGALGEFEAFKDVYRNSVMHSRRSYDEHEAASAMLHVREFMTRLAKKIESENPKAIRWGKM